MGLTGGAPGGDTLSADVDLLLAILTGQRRRRQADETHAGQAPPGSHLAHVLRPEPSGRRMATSVKMRSILPAATGYAAVR
jgi:LDH2 family malate/lactate/ureidoglycolate dehydrogenase